jgi:hypothetical protein
MPPTARETTLLFRNRRRRSHHYLALPLARLNPVRVPRRLLPSQRLRLSLVSPQYRLDISTISRINISARHLS